MKNTTKGSFSYQLANCEDVGQLLPQILDSMMNELSEWTEKFCLCDRHIIVLALRRVADAMESNMSIVEKIGLELLNKSITTNTVTYPSKKTEEGDDEA